jgi:lysozyme family protein
MIFDEMIEFIIDRIEKGYSNNPKDKGGETNWGISVRAYPELEGKIKNLSKDDAKKIYRRDYFTPAGIAKYPARVRLAVLDGAINLGITRNNKIVQKTLNSMGHKLLVDGVMGPLTLAAVQKSDPLTFLASYGRQRLAFYRSLDDYSWAGPSWEYRLFLVCSAP